MRSPWCHVVGGAIIGALGAVSCGGPTLEGSGGSGAGQVTGGGDAASGGASATSPEASSSAASGAAPSGELSDEFEGTSLDASWSLVNAGNFERRVDGGALHLRPTTNTLWWMGDATGALVHKLVTGDFKLTTSVRARRASNPSQPVGPTDYQFGGIMARAPGGGPESYVFVVVGDRGASLEIEAKSTTLGESAVQGQAWPSGDAELRLCRVGARFHLYKRPVGGGAWQVATEWGPPYDRPDLPDTLQVGPIAYAWTNQPDLLASFDYARFEEVASEADCTTN
jgi:hypothetical protein